MLGHSSHIIDLDVAKRKQVRESFVTGHDVTCRMGFNAYRVEGVISISLATKEREREGKGRSERARELPFRRSEM